MARVTCTECYVQFTQGDTPQLRVCPNCGAPPVPFWRRMLAWGWPLPVAIGLVLQLIAGTVAQTGAGGQASQLGLGAAAAISRFLAGALVFSLFAMAVTFVSKRAYQAYRVWCRWRARRQRRRARTG